MLPMMIGEQPSRTGDTYHHFPLSGAVAQTLCQMAEIEPQSEGTRYGRWTWALYDVFDCVNVIERYKPWDAREAAQAIAGLIEPGREVVVLLGRRAQQAYVDMQAPGESVLDGLEFFEWVVDPVSPTGRRELVVIPHPSRLNRLYNETNPHHQAGRIMRRRAGVVLQAAVEKAKQLQETRL